MCDVLAQGPLDIPADTHLVFVCVWGGGGVAVSCWVRGLVIASAVAQRIHWLRDPAWPPAGGSWH